MAHASPARTVARAMERRGITRAGMTRISVLVALAAAVWFARGDESGALVGSAFLVLVLGCDAVRSAIRGGRRDSLTLWLVTVLGQLREYLVYAGLALGAVAAGVGGAWAWAAGALIALALRDSLLVARTAPGAVPQGPEAARAALPAQRRSEGLLGGLGVPAPRPPGDSDPELTGRLLGPEGAPRRGRVPLGEGTAKRAEAARGGRAPLRAETSPGERGPRQEGHPRREEAAREGGVPPREGTRCGKTPPGEEGSLWDEAPKRGGAARGREAPQYGQAPRREKSSPCEEVPGQEGAPRGGKALPGKAPRRGRAPQYGEAPAGARAPGRNGAEVRGAPAVPEPSATPAVPAFPATPAAAVVSLPDLARRWLSFTQPVRFLAIGVTTVLWDARVAFVTLVVGCAVAATSELVGAGDRTERR